MKIFISWSGKPSLNVATALRDWLPYIFNGIELFVSSEDIRKGKRWPLEVSSQLETSNFGIVCLTHDNLEAPWLLFESGALSKSVKEASVYTLLVGGLKNTDIEGPLSHFQHTLFEKDDFFKLIRSVNEAHGETKQAESRLKKIFDKFWDELEENVSRAIKLDSKPEKKKQTADEMLAKLLELTDYIARNLPPVALPGLIEELKRTAVVESADSFWESFVAQVSKQSPFAGRYLEKARGAFANGTLTISYPKEFEDYGSLVDNPRNQKMFQTILSSLGLGNDCKIKIQVSTPPPPRKVAT